MGSYELPNPTVTSLTRKGLRCVLLSCLRKEARCSSMFVEEIVLPNPKPSLSNSAKSIDDDGLSQKIQNFCAPTFQLPQPA